MTRRVPGILLLGVASGLSVFGMTIVIPSMSSIAGRYNAEFASVQFVVSAYLFGLAVAQPVSGFLCDRFGRRKIMLAGFSLFVVASLLCAFSPNLELLILSRFLQAVGVSVGTVTTRAILRDTRTGEEMTQAMSWIAAAMGVAPIVAPVFGGLIDSAVGYEWIFLVSAAIGVAVYLGMFWRLEETLSLHHATTRWKDTLLGYGTLLRSRKFAGYTLIYGFVQGTFFSFLAVGSDYFSTRFGIDAKSFGIMWGLMAITYVIGASAAARILPRIGSKALMNWSMLLLVAGGIAMLLITREAHVTPARILVPLGLMMMVAGSVTPGSMAGAVRYHPEYAGTASGLSSAIGLLLSGAFTVISGSLYVGNFEPIALLMFVSCAATALSWALAIGGQSSSSPSTS